MSRFTPTTVALALLVGPSAFAATITVDTAADVIDSSGDCSLREAVIAANTNAAVDGCAAGEAVGVAVDQILVPAGTYTLAITGSDESWQVGGGSDPYDVVDQPDTTIGDIDILESAHIMGDGSANTFVQWGAGEDRIFHVAAVGADDVLAELTGLTITGGHVPVEVVNPSDPPDQQWSLRRLGGGVAVGAGGSMKLEGTSGSDEGNSGPPDVHVSGGDPSLALVDVVIDGNSSDGDGGGLFSGGDLTAQQLVVSNNTCGGNGGGIYHEGDLDLTDVALLDNTAEGGGAMFMTGGTTGTLLRGLIRGNYAVGGGGLSARALVVVELLDTTIAENEAFDVGGGMYTNGLFQLGSCTVVDNFSGSDASFGGGGLNTFGGGLFQIENTILAGNLAGVADANCGCTGGSCQVTDYFSSDGYNLEDFDTCALDDTTDVVDTDPMLAAVADNGGPFESYALMVGSPAIDGGAPACSTTDNRGAVRPADGDGDGTASCDIGAFELAQAELDLDGDGFCVGLDIDGVAVCADGSSPGDCDDADTAAFPGNPEVCDGIDNDCANGADDGLTFEDWYLDSDLDTYGDPVTSANTCDGAPTGYVADNTDCDDADATAFPGNPEVCDGVDNDCANGADDGLTFEDWYQDSDSDTYGDLATTVSTCDGAPTGYVADSTDCDDTAAAVNPAATEVCNAGVDDDCNGDADDADAGVDSTTFINFYADSDDDGFGDAATSVAQCLAPAGYLVDSTDCDDTSDAVNPDATEICNEIDDDCDDDIDDADDSVEPETSFYADVDGDGFGDPDAAVLACVVPADHVDDLTDCDDSNADVFPGAEEIKNDIDDDCDGLVDKDDEDFKGCGCSASGGTGAPAGLMAFALALGAMVRRRR